MAIKKKKTTKKAAKRPAKKAAPKKKTAKKAAKKTTARKPARKAAKKKTTKKKATTAKRGAKSVKKAAPKAPAKKAGPTPPAKPVLVTPKNKSSKQFTQSEFFECLRGSCGFDSRKDAKEFYEAFAGMLHSALKSGYKIPMPGLGKIQVRRTKARMGRNPMTQETIKIPAKKKVAFTANKALKDAVL